MSRGMGYHWQALLGVQPFAGGLHEVSAPQQVPQRAPHWFAAGFQLSNTTTHEDSDSRKSAGFIEVHAYPSLSDHGGVDSQGSLEVDSAAWSSCIDEQVSTPLSASHTAATPTPAPATPSPWAGHLVGVTFFGPCPRHSSSPKNEVHFYCSACSPSLGGGMCQLCLEQHAVTGCKGPCMQVYRYMYNDVVRVADVGSEPLDGIQAYSANGHLAVHLRPREITQGKRPPTFTHRCEGGCGRALTAQWAFCSLACKLQALALVNTPAAGVLRQGPPPRHSSGNEGGGASGCNAAQGCYTAAQGVDCAVGAGAQGGGRYRTAAALTPEVSFPPVVPLSALRRATHVRAGGPVPFPDLLGSPPGSEAAGRGCEAATPPPTPLGLLPLPGGVIPQEARRPRTAGRSLPQRGATPAAAAACSTPATRYSSPSPSAAALALLEGAVAIGPPPPAPSLDKQQQRAAVAASLAAAGPGRPSQWWLRGSAMPGGPEPAPAPAAAQQAQAPGVVSPEAKRRRKPGAPRCSPAL